MNIPYKQLYSSKDPKYTTSIHDNISQEFKLNNSKPQVQSYLFSNHISPIFCSYTF